MKPGAGWRPGGQRGAIAARHGRRAGRGAPPGRLLAAAAPPLTRGGGVRRTRAPRVMLKGDARAPTWPARPGAPLAGTGAQQAPGAGGPWSHLPAEDPALAPQTRTGRRPADSLPATPGAQFQRRFFSLPDAGVKDNFFPQKIYHQKIISHATSLGLNFACSWVSMNPTVRHLIRGNIAKLPATRGSCWAGSRVLCDTSQKHWKPKVTRHTSLLKSSLSGRYGFCTNSAFFPCFFFL